ncbi:hypothetical protein CROQUDRAFT_86633 [Cronartium quercuum f. sp. fusiforme G11]|uniref:Thioester reductase (TE) domain-containing protein n=1 Tax=Cronartium quercuum f. sp. fusiforme G11 TaxID=708437 RepID=A0A9P6NTC6_9BASI|nr:hypothetical protein CROQUDRAFT_86633 [Cronartium quercuum f. sp. fusiforme G11]
MSSDPNKRVVLITGTTGGLGAHILEHMLKTRAAVRIFGLNRSVIGGPSATDRQKTAFQSRGLDANLLEDPIFTLIAANSLEDIPSKTREELESGLTHILHFAYPVNFNLTLASFEPSVQFTQSLLELAARVTKANPKIKPNFVFASSVATLASFKGREDEWVEESQVEMASCLGGGYGESKRVCEEIIEAYVKAHGFTAVILRIGQMCGSRQHGAWNMSEWLPLLVQSAVTLGCLPNGADNVAWLPVDEAAIVINELSFHPRLESEPFVYRHVVHPRATTWSNIMQPIARWISENVKPPTPIELVSYPVWLAKLTAKIEAGAPASLGAAKLIEFYSSSPSLHDQAQPGTEALGVRRLVTTRSEAESPRLRECKPLSEADALGWLEYWNRMGHFNHKA